MINPYPTVIWELTHSCDLACRFCPTLAEGVRNEELSTFEGYKTIDQIAALKPRRFVISGGDPLRRGDIDQLVEYARRRGLDPAIAVSPSHRLTAEKVHRLRQNGARRIIFSIDGSTPERHERVRGACGSFGATMRAMRWARDAAQSIEVNTLVTRQNRLDLSQIADLIEQFGIDAWNVYFLVPIGAARNVETITADEAEQALAILVDLAAVHEFRIRTVKAPQYRRLLLQRDNVLWADFAGYVDADGIGATLDNVVFIASNGDVRPSEFLPISAGNLRYRSLTSIYRSSDLFVALHDDANLKGKCGRCEYKLVCGGSRARAWAVSGDLFATDPMCAYAPKSV